jgi:hypothetical protein
MKKVEEPIKNYSRRLIAIFTFCFLLGALGILDNLYPTPEGEVLQNPERHPDEKGKWEIMYYKNGKLIVKQVETYNEILKKKKKLGKTLVLFRDVTRTGQIFRRVK